MEHREEIKYSFIKKNSTRCNDVSKFYYSIIIWVQHVSGDTPPIIRSLKLHWQPLVFLHVEGCWTCSWWTLSGTYCAWKSPAISHPLWSHTENKCLYLYGRLIISFSSIAVFSKSVNYCLQIQESFGKPKVCAIKDFVPEKKRRDCEHTQIET